MDVSGLSSIERISSGTPLHFLECASCTESTTDSESRHFLYMLWSKLQVIMGFPDSSIGKESPCNAGDPDSIPGSGRSVGEGMATHSSIPGLPLWLSWQRIRLQCSRCGFNPWIGKIPWRKGRLPTPVFWPREFYGLYSPCGCKESDTTE